jgi:NAD(P)-dependent dehydrogenase (short-subunit alcohol dehydrogenase family)
MPSAPSGNTEGEGKIAIVTGASGSVGGVCARALLEAGWNVVLTGRDARKLESAIQSAGVNGDRALAVACDITREVEVDRLFAEVKSRFGRLDLLFNNAGTFGTPELPDELPGAAWRQIVDTNLTGAFYCLSRAFALMREQSPRGGRIINNGSISAHVPRPRCIAYTATKHAVTGLTRAAALDGRSFDIAVGQIDIGNAGSEMTSWLEVGALQANGRIEPEPRMDLSAVSRAFMTMVELPLSANMLFVTVMATKMPYVGRG